MKNENKDYPVIIIGGGPSGISCSQHLKKYGIDHIIIEKKEMLQTWKHERWDSFFMVTPNWMTNLPGVDHKLPYNNEYMSKDEIYLWLKTYMEHVNPTYSDHTTIDLLKKLDNRYHISTNKGVFLTDNIIVATGLFNKPFVPEVSNDLPENINQLHSIDYFNPEQLLDGGTIVVGSGRSGVQIALEIKIETPNDVYLSVGSMTPLPTIYRNVNGVYWLNRLSGYSKGKTILPYKHDDLENKNIHHKIIQNLFSCESEGVELTGRFMTANNQSVHFADNLCDVLEEGAEYLKKVEKQIDDEIHHSNLNFEDVQVDFNLKALDCHRLKPTTQVNITEHNIKNVIWCTGFRPDYSWIDLNIFDDKHMPILQNGYETEENVFFCGMGLHPDKNTKSSFGVGLFAFNESAERAVEALVRRNQLDE